MKARLCLGTIGDEGAIAQDFEVARHEWSRHVELAWRQELVASRHELSPKTVSKKTDSIEIRVRSDV